jgi:symplekin
LFLRGGVYISLTIFSSSNFLVAFQSLDVLAGLLNDGNAWTVKIAVQTLAGAYPLLFRRMCVTQQDLLDPPRANDFNPFLHPPLFRFPFEYRCTNKNERAQWETLTRAKNRIIDFMWAPGAQAGVQFAAVKFLQRVILVQSRGVADPRVSVIFPCTLQN